MFELIAAIFKGIFELITTPPILFSILLIVVVLLMENARYKKTAYYTITHTPYFAVLHDIGKFGEYMTYKKLKSYEEQGWKFLFNLYIPKDDATTTEIDVLAISPKGIFVFESKNYSGWIFGNETQKNWTQVLPKGRGRSNKEHFLNPIIQNKGHIKYLKKLLGDDITMHSLIVFSERCTLKDVTLKTDTAVVIKREDIRYAVANVCEKFETEQLTLTQMNEIYNTLYPLTQVDAGVKEKHISDIHAKGKPAETPAPITVSESSEETQPAEQAVLVTDAPPVQESASLKCPKCGGDLVLRVARRGANKGKEFYGCSNYPKCKHIQ